MNYKLLKDLPDVNAGKVSEFLLNNGMSNIYCFGRYEFNEDFINQHPDWFEPIPDEEILQGFADDEDGVKCHIWFETEAGMTITIPSILIRNPSEETKRKLGL